MNLNSLDVKQKVVLVRLDLNVPIENGKVTSQARIVASLPTLQYLLDAGAKVIVLAHRARPKEGVFDESLSLKPIAECLSALLQQTVELRDFGDYSKPNFSLSAIAMLENVRFNSGESGDDDILAQKYAAIADVFVMDAFGCAHRKQASITGLARHIKTTVPGLLVQKELAALKKAVTAPKLPILTIVGGSKVSSKLQVLQTLAKTSTHLIAGGGIANTFLLAAGYKVGKSLCEPDLIDTAKQILALGSVELPKDVVVAKQLDVKAEGIVKDISTVADDDIILDIGPITVQHFSAIIQKCHTILINGPVGVFEIPQFARGTESLFTAIARSQSFSVAGGGDTIAALEKFSLLEYISYVSTGGGAFLEFLEGKKLPGLILF